MDHTNGWSSRCGQPPPPPQNRRQLQQQQSQSRESFDPVVSVHKDNGTGPRQEKNASCLLLLSLSSLSAPRKFDISRILPPLLLLLLLLLLSTTEFSVVDVSMSFPPTALGFTVVETATTTRRRPRLLQQQQFRSQTTTTLARYRVTIRQTSSITTTTTTTHRCMVPATTTTTTKQTPVDVVPVCQPNEILPTTTTSTVVPNRVLSFPNNNENENNNNNDYHHNHQHPELQPLTIEIHPTNPAASAEAAMSLPTCFSSLFSSAAASSPQTRNAETILVMIDDDTRQNSKENYNDGKDDSATPRAADDNESSTVTETAETTEEEYQDEDGKTETQEQQQPPNARVAAVARAALLSRRGSATSTSAKQQEQPSKPTSVGERRVGSATKARQGPGATGKILDVLRKTARGAAAAAAAKQSQQPPPQQQQDTLENGAKSSPEAAWRSSSSNSRNYNNNMDPTLQASPNKNNILNPSFLHAAIQDILSRRESPPANGLVAVAGSERTTLHAAATTTEHHNHGPSIAPLTALRDAATLPMGLLGEPVAATTRKTQFSHEEPSMPAFLAPGGIILQDATMTVRLGTPMDDLHVAKLRLSVFSDVSVEMQSQFCTRSCQAIANRRRRGATCIVATLKSSPTATRTTTSTSSSLQSKFAQAAAANAWNVGDGMDDEDGMIVGSAECSFHEFSGTRLGLSRPAHSILYVTEVAVNPTARRKGIGKRLLDAIDVVAKNCYVETLYLHVDVANHAALALYQKAGYQQVTTTRCNNHHHHDPAIFLEFTTSLNLHNGATKGRNHYLLFKDLTPHPTWLVVTDQNDVSVTLQQQQNSADKSRNENGKMNSVVVGNLGFAIPA